MNHLLKLSTVNLLLRGLSSASKFILIIYFAKYFTISDLGIFGLFISAISFAIYFLGFDFYNYNAREIIAQPTLKTGILIRDQFVFFGVNYLIFLPLFILVFQQDFLDYQYIFWFYLILIFEHFSIEFFRIFTVISKPIFANFIFFIKSGLWSYFLIVLWLLGNDSFKTLNMVWVTWFIGNFLATVISLIYLHINGIKVLITNAVNWKWIKKGIKISIPFFASTISLKTIELLGRFIIDKYYTKGEVGIYTFYWTIANLVNIVIFTALIMVLYPKLIELYQKKKYEKFKIAYSKFKYSIIAISLLLGGLLIIFIKPIIAYLNKDAYTVQISTFYILVVSNIILNISYIPHYLLYVKEKDKYILYSTILGTIVNVILSFILIPEIGVIGAAWAIFFSYLVILLFKSVFNIFEKK
ncbi:MAG: polysaccharide biosynthesis C-terminal domain-containing protein [Calditrichia bacterium]|nr:polysaccharide biosynthesis C-terminal domain-containing protein [Calditrichia bacterium]